MKTINVLLGGLLVAVAVSSAAAATLEVGSDKQYTRIADAIAAASSGDTIRVQAGVYENEYATITKDLTIQGVGGFAHFKTTSLIPNGKGVFITRANVTFSNIEFSGATVNDRNGAGIRQETGNLTVVNSYFHDNEEGILGGSDPNSVVTIRNSEFARNGFGDGQSHGVYLNRIKRAVITDSYFHGTKVGHHIKSRAAETVVLNNRLMDREDGTSSYSIDAPNGGRVVIRGNVLQQGQENQNWTEINFGNTSIKPDNKLNLRNNTIVNESDDFANALHAWDLPRTTKGNVVADFHYKSMDYSTNLAFVRGANDIRGWGPDAQPHGINPFADDTNYDYRLTNLEGTGLWNGGRVGAKDAVAAGWDGMLPAYAMGTDPAAIWNRQTAQGELGIDTSFADHSFDNQHLNEGAVDSFNLTGLTAGMSFVAFTNNNISGCATFGFCADLGLGAFNAAGGLIGADDDSSPLGNGLASAMSGVVNADGSLHLKVSSFNDADFDGVDDGTGNAHNERGDYGLFVVLGIDDVADLTGLLSGEVDIVTFSGLLPYATFVAEIEDGGFDTMIALLGADGALLASDDDGGFGELSRLIGTVGADGVVRLAVSGYGDNAFTGDHLQNGAYSIALETERANLQLSFDTRNLGDPVAMSEPGAILLLGLGIAGIGFIRLRARRPTKAA